MWRYRKLFKISWVDKVTNEEVLNLVKEKRNLYASIKRCRDRMIGHILRHEGLEGTLLEGTVEGLRWKGRKRLQYVKQIIDDVGFSGYCDMKRFAQDREGRFYMAICRITSCHKQKKKKKEYIESCIKPVPGLLTIITTTNIWSMVLLA